MITALLLLGMSTTAAQDTDPAPLRLGVAGLTHDHVFWLLDHTDRDDVEIVGIAEPNQALAQRYAEQYDLDPELLYSDLDAMLDEAAPEAVAAFGPIYDHKAVVEASAPRGIHVMVEKPLAVSVEHAEVMQRLANEHGIHLLTNYETTWYASNQDVYAQIHEAEALGDIRKMVARHGHQGPKEIGVTDVFLEWLTDPIQNGGGALIDFGCYGANLMTWLMQGAVPETVTAVTQQIKPDIYPEVDDEATIIVTYPKAQGIIQASWNWPYNRKDLSVYGQDGAIHAMTPTQVRQRRGDASPTERKMTPRSAPFDDPFSYFAAVVRGTVEVAPTDLSSLENNVTVVRILDAARRSAQTGETIHLSTQ
jgi:predicted dehydrogenase